AVASIIWPRATRPFYQHYSLVERRLIMVIRGINEPARDAPKFHHDLERLAVPQEGVVAFKYFDDLLASIALVPRVYNTGSGFIVDSFDEICLVHAGGSPSPSEQLLVARCRI
ncbi:hypothetical protein, partial [Chromohalobacter sp. HP20-39]